MSAFAIVGVTQPNGTNNNTLATTAFAKLASVPGWIVKNVAYTANSGDFLFVDTSAAPVSITLPLNPGVGSVVNFSDPNNTWNTNNLTVLNNGRNIIGQNVPFIGDVAGASFYLVYSGGSTGWKAFSGNSSVPGGAGIQGPSGAITNLSTAIPLMNSGTGASGSSTNASPSDHVHPTDTSRLAKSGDKVTGALDLAPAVTIASAATTAIGAATSNFVNITGTTTISAFDSVAESVIRYIRFAASGLVLTYNASSLTLPTGGNITTLAGDTATFRSLGAGNWQCISYQKSDGTAISLITATAADLFIGTNVSKPVTPKSIFDSSAFVTLTDAANVSVDLSTFLNAQITLGGNRTLTNPVNAKAGQSGVIRVLQDATGSRTLTFGSAYDFGSAGTPTLSTAVGKEDLISYIVVDSTTPRLRCAFLRGA